MAASGQLERTFIVFCSDHGDFLGDHWLGEKELFYDTVQRVPFIVVDPRREADVTRGTVESRFVECVDVVPTLLDALGIEAAEHRHRIEGRSLQPLLHKVPPTAPWREFVFSELDYSFRQARLILRKDVHQCRAFSLRDARWRYVYWVDEPEQLFDLQADPQEFNDLGRDPANAAVRAAMRDKLVAFLARRHHRTTLTDAQVAAGTHSYKKAGVFFGQW
jgi:arylsulfatase A-like enzyme